MAYLCTPTHIHTHQILEALNKDLKAPLRSICVDGAMAASDRLLELQANLFGIRVGMAHGECFDVILITCLSISLPLCTMFHLFTL